MADDTRVPCVLVTRPGFAPFAEWYGSIADVAIRLRILGAISKLADPAFRNYKSVGSGVFEIRLFVGAGYRVYFGRWQGRLIVLIGGGDKSSQRRDIDEAKKLWKAFKDGIGGALRDFDFE